MMKSQVSKPTIDHHFHSEIRIIEALFLYNHDQWDKYYKNQLAQFYLHINDIRTIYESLYIRQKISSKHA